MSRPLPPRNRGRLGRRRTAAAAFGRFELPVCQDCKVIQFPVREICGVCLSANLKWQEIEGCGAVLAPTAIHHSVDPYMQQRAPVSIGSVRLDAGPVVFAFIARGCEQPGTRVRILNRLDRSGQSVLVAISEAAAEDVMVLPDPNREIMEKVVLIFGAEDEVSRALADAFRSAGGKVLGSVDPSAASAVDILVNNMSANRRAPFLSGASLDGARDEMEQNYFRLIESVRAVAPAMRERGQGLILNVLAVLGHVSDPAMGSYCASQAAAMSATQALRAELIPSGIRVCGLYAGTVDTAANNLLPPPKLSPAALARAAVTMIKEGIEDQYPGTAAELYAAFRESPKTLEREMAARVV
jgi:NAD(P)-dependent dehydrogenase (short-subunit alcohol dehydrogenase family)/uncharacterized OB-fold protein